MLGVCHAATQHERCTLQKDYLTNRSSELDFSCSVQRSAVPSPARRRSRQTPALGRECPTGMARHGTARHGTACRILSAADVGGVVEQVLGQIAVASGLPYAWMRPVSAAP